MERIWIRNKVFVIVFSLIFLMGLESNSAAKTQNIAMVLWRGETKAEEGFRAGLRDIVGLDCRLTVFNADQSMDKLQKIVFELDESSYDLIYSFGTTITKTLKNQIRRTPIVFCIVSRPIKAGIINSWESSGCNITGASNAVPMTSVFQTLSKVMYIGRLGFVYNPKEANSIIQRNEIDSLQEKFGYTMIEGAIDSVDQIPQLLNTLIKAKVDAVLLPSDSFVKTVANDLIPHLNREKIPSIVSIPEMVKDNGAFIGLGPDYFELGKMAAAKAQMIFSGYQPTNIPSTTLDRQHLTVNLETARKIGVSVPIQILRISTIIR